MLAFVQQFRQRREDMGISQTDVGRRMGLGTERSHPSSWIYGYEYGLTAFSGSRLLTWVAALECDLVLEPALDPAAARRRWSPPAGGDPVVMDRTAVAAVLADLEQVAEVLSAAPGRSQSRQVVERALGVLRAQLGEDAG